MCLRPSALQKPKFHFLYSARYVLFQIIEEDEEAGRGGGRDEIVLTNTPRNHPMH
jgi:hypothetical protein